MEKLFFDVKKVPMNTLVTSGLKFKSGITHGIVGKDTLIHTCSADYGLMENRRVYDGFVEYFKAHKMAFKASGTNFNDARFSMDFALTDFPMEIGNREDKIFPSIRVLNSYNGTQRYSFAIRVLREVCTNGLTALVDEKAIDMLHTPQVEDGQAVEKSIALLTEFLEIYEEAAEPFIELQDFPVRDIPSRIEEVATAVKFPVGLTEYAIERALHEITDLKFAPTDWIVYNALNFQLNHHADNLVGRKADTLDKKVLDYLLTY